MGEKRGEAAPLFLGGLRVGLEGLGEVLVERLEVPEAREVREATRRRTGY